ncbi:DNA-directed DNA polymerase [Trema orientale]|uniref:DNA-directed DNA polymerase n=1 Tax=Trema orientale TaxID=63057 RepID=A0A2P5FGG5_TREOI|nr:DNA-directed DNA polymerase [Trema orientale]
MGENTIQNNARFNTCIELPPQINSPGFLNGENPSSKGLLKNSLPELELQMIMIFGLSQTFHFVFKRLGLPKISSDILTGLVLGYALVDDKGNPINERLFTPAGEQIMGTVSIFGYCLFLFLTGVKMNVGMISKTGTMAMTIAVGALLVPFFCGLITKEFIGGSLKPQDKDELSFVFITQTLVPFPVIASLITELNILNSELGWLGLSAALVSDLIGFSLTASFLMVRVLLESKSKALIDSAATIAYVAIAVFVIRPLMFRIIKNTPEGRPVKDVYVYSIIVLAMASSIFSEAIDQQVYMAPYILGLAIPEGPPLGSAIASKLDCFVSGVFVPLYVTTSVLRADLRRFKFDTLTTSSIILVMVTTVSKFIACFMSCTYYEMPMLDSWALSFIMTSKGIVEIGLYTLFRDLNNLAESTFNFLIISILATSAIAPIFVKFLYDPSRKYAGYQKRNLMHLKPDSELRVLVCIHRPDDIPAMINLLDASSPTKESPISVYVLHLIELIGRSSPIFISHQAQRKSLSEFSYSQNVILSFRLFENNNWEAITINAFTAVSPPKLMHDDICTLALDKLTSLMILPFHRKWSLDGHVEFDDNMLRSLNSKVLEIAPCSVGILVHRGESGRAGTLLSSLDAYMYSICMIFLGGRDDREALTYAKRMARASNTTLTVFHLVPPEEGEVEDDRKWDLLLDSEVLKDVKYNSLNGNQQMRHAQKFVSDGSEMAMIISSLVDEYDLIIAGRSHSIGSHQISGLDLGWTKFPELGVVGDMLASMDIYGRASALVIQQQATDDG